MTNQHALLLVVALGLLLEAPVALGQGAAPAGDAVDTFPTCGHVRPLVRAGSQAEEQYWSAVPTNRLLIPVQYEQFAAASPAPEDILAGLTVQVLNTEGEVPGVVVAAERLANAGSYVVTWVPDEPMTPGQHLQANVTAGTYPDPEECAILYADFYFIFTVSEQSPKEWLAAATLTLSAPTTTLVDVAPACCDAGPGTCASSETCAICWDMIGSPLVRVEWIGPGLVYLSRSTTSNSPLVIEHVSTDLLDEYSLTGSGEFCIQGSVSTDGVEPRTVEVCGAASPDPNRRLDVEIECRALVMVPVSACEVLPYQNDLIVLYTVEGTTTDEARAALAVEPEQVFHPAIGCYDSAAVAPPAEPTDAATPASSSNSGDGDPLGPDERPEAVAPKTDSSCSLRAPVSTGGLPMLVALWSLLLLRRRRGSLAHTDGAASVELRGTRP